MKFEINWYVEDHSTSGVKKLATGKVVKEAEDRNAMNHMIDTQLRPMMESSFPKYTAYTTREYVIDVTELP